MELGKLFTGIFWFTVGHVLVFIQLNGQRDEMYKKVGEIRSENKYMPLEEVYEKAYSIVMKTG